MVSIKKNRGIKYWCKFFLKCKEFREDSDTCTLSGGDNCRKFQEFTNKKEKKPLELECPNEYTHCKYYHPELDQGFRCIKDSTTKACIKELRMWVGINNQASIKLEKNRGNS